MEPSQKLVSVVLFVAVASVGLWGCGATAKGEAPVAISNQGNLPVVKADIEHLQAERSDGSVPPFYDIPAGDGFVLDTGTLHLQIPPSLKISAPNSIQIVVDRQMSYGATWSASQSSYVLTAKTLKPLQGSKPFDGLKANQAVIIAIGYLDETGQTTGQAGFYPLWYAIAKVH